MFYSYTAIKCLDTQQFTAVCRVSGKNPSTSGKSSTCCMKCMCMCHVVISSEQFVKLIPGNVFARVHTGI